MANELLHARARDKVLETDFGQRLKVLSDRVESALHTNDQLDL
jgi:hypothetical protein